MYLVIKKHTHLRFYISLSLFIILLFLRYSLQLGIPRFILTFTIILIAVMGDRDEIMAISMCCIPLHAAIDVFYALVACAAAYVIKNPKRIRIDYIIPLVLTMIAWEILHCFDVQFSVQTFLVTIIPLIFIAVVLCVDVSDVDYAFIVRILSMVIVGLCVVLFSTLIIDANFNFIVAMAGLRRLGMASEDNEIIGSAINPNTLGVICVLGLTALLQLFIIRRYKKSDIVLMIFLFLFGVFTASRTFLICFLLMILLFVLGQHGTIKKKIQFLLLILVLGIAIVYVLYRFFPDFMDYYAYRWEVSDITTGRSNLQTLYFRFINRNPQIMHFGIGLHDYKGKLIEQYKVSSNVPHNCIQEIIIAWGIPGLIMILALIVDIMIRSRKYGKKKYLIQYIPLIIILIKSLVGQLLTSNYSMLALSFAFLSLCQDFTSTDKIDEVYK